MCDYISLYEKLLEHIQGKERQCISTFVPSGFTKGRAPVDPESTVLKSITTKSKHRSMSF